MAEREQIVTMCMSPAEETLAISTDRGQMYRLSLATVHLRKVHLHRIQDIQTQSSGPNVASSVDDCLYVRNSEDRI